MDEKQKEKLLMYLRNANPFFWGIIPGNKDYTRERLKDLRLKIDVSAKATYASLLENLIDLNGFDAIVNAIIKQVTEKLYSPEDLERLRGRWHEANLPDIAFIRRYKLDIENVLVKVNNQLDYVEGWTTFAGVWFEEIEPWIKEQGKNC